MAEQKAGTLAGSLPSWLFCGARQKRRNRWWLQRPIRWRKVAVRLLQQYRPCQPMWVVVRGMRVLT
ncbi:hypothetical protein FV140_20085 [Paenarthrobacter ureafaciens]|uniref:hypothetical protein n=1 Tax=Paenarthrobacter sp. AT5 TaxID=2973089 RepID=UPI001112F5EF|nr:hypothetical protein [Paenarthrobacter sp. AT5]QMU84118.1 hypothetical protein FV140_20085 [Paenarthrobacter ureafaciens]WOC60771.1 hypothetical protein RI444_20100 [Paenarthrobacter sp. AT5]